jgi:hypothetical protein
VLALVALVAATVGVLLIRGSHDRSNVVPVRDVERRLAREARRQGMNVHAVQCVRAQGLPRSFDCFVEGADDLHLAYRVTVARDGDLDVRAPGGP